MFFYSLHFERAPGLDMERAALVALVDLTTPTARTSQDFIAIVVAADDLIAEFGITIIHITRGPRGLA